MTRNLFRLALAILIMGAASAVRAENVRISATAGTVEVRTSESGAWAPATVGMEVPEGGAVRTSGDGRAELAYPNGGKVWLKESSQVVNESQSSLVGRLSMAFGSLKAKFPHLARRQRMEFKTQTAVAAIRGTEITIAQTPDGKFDLNVLFGKVELRMTGIPKSIDVLQGHGYGSNRPGENGNNRLLTKIEEVRGQEDWRPGLTPDQAVAGLVAKEQNRDTMQGFVRQDAQQRAQLQDVVGRAKEADLEAGRTLIDIHGNLVRVDQRLLRPSDHELQIVNLVKRPSYDYDSTATTVFGSNCPAGNGNCHFAYNGGSGIANRLDAMQLRMDYGAGNKLPDEIPAWPNFFKDHSPDKMSIIFTNQTNPLDIFEIAISGKRDSAQGDLDSNLYVGRVKCTDSKACLEGMTDFANSKDHSGEIVGSNNLAGQAEGCGNATANPGGCFKKYQSVNGLGNEDHSPEDTFAEVSAQPFSADGTASSVVWLAHEMYVTNNDGKIRKVDDFTTSDSDPFTIMKETAFENILYVKTDVSGLSAPTALGCNKAHCVGGADAPAANNRNIDLVVTPDIILATIQKIITQIDKVKAD